MAQITNPTVHQHMVGTCPACRSGIWAEVTIQTNISEPILYPDSKVSVRATPNIVGMDLPAHRCDKRQDDNEPEPPATSEGASA